MLKIHQLEASCLDIARLYQPPRDPATAGDKGSSTGSRGPSPGEEVQLSGGTSSIRPRPNDVLPSQGNQEGRAQESATAATISAATIPQTTCSVCRCPLSDKAHYKSDFHRYNLKRVHIFGAEPITEADFEDQLSGNDPNHIFRLAC
jgi:hypothetical protein